MSLQVYGFGIAFDRTSQSLQGLSNDAVAIAEALDTSLILDSPFVEFSPAALELGFSADLSLPFAFRANERDTSSDAWLRSAIAHGEVAASMRQIDLGTAWPFVPEWQLIRAILFHRLLRTGVVIVEHSSGDVAEANNCVEESPDRLLERLWQTYAMNPANETPFVGVVRWH